MKKKILFLIPTLGHGGAERVLVNLVNNLDQNKFDITIQTLFDVGINRQYILPHIKYIPGYKRQFRGNSYLIKLFSPKLLYKHIVKNEYDIVISYLEGPTTRVIAGCSAVMTKKICWIHSGFETVEQSTRCFNSMKEACAAYNSYDKIIAVSQGVREHFTNHLTTHTDIEVLYNTNETEQIQLKAQLPMDDFKCDSSTPVVCSVGKLIQVKRFDRLLNVHKRLIDEGIYHRIIIVGTGEQKRELEQSIQKYGLEESFILIGFKENPYPYMAHCNFYICSSQREGFSTAVTEALIVGTPVVSTDCSGARELLGEHDEYGLVVENSEEGIYRGMKRMLENPELMAHYKKQAELRGKAFSREKTVKAVERMLDSL